MDQTSTARTNERPIHRACVVAGCPCKSDGVVPARQTALAAIVARGNGGLPADFAHLIPRGGSSGCPLPEAPPHN